MEYKKTVSLDRITTKLLDLPCRIKAFTVADKNGDFTIVLNSRLSREQNLLSYNHELYHIQNGDFDKKCSADLIEVFAHENREEGSVLPHPKDD